MKIFAFVTHLLLVSATIAAAGDTPAPITLRDFKLIGDLTGGHAAFTLTATAHVENRNGGEIELLRGAAALTELGPHPKWRVRAEPDRYVAVFERRGDFPIQLNFNAAVRQSDGWNTVDFSVAPSALQSVVLQKLAADTQFQFAGAARPERVGDDFKSVLPPDGAVRLSWKEAAPEATGKLFYAAEMLEQISVSPGLMRQVALLDFKVMQGEMSRVSLRLHGAGEVTRVQGDHVLSWNVESGTNASDRRLIVQLNQPQKDHFALQVQMQTPMGAFPQTADAMQLQPDAATRFAGAVRIVNDGAVRLEVAQASGMSQISPEQFPENESTRGTLRWSGTQRFAYRFSGADYALRIQADQILPELAVSQVLAYHHGENEQSIDAEIELDIRDAPLRELLLRVPTNYVVSSLTASGLSDYFLRTPAGQPDAELRLMYGQPASGRQVVQLRLERNQALDQTEWTLPRVEVLQAKSVRGYVGVATDAGFRLTPSRTQGLTDIATAFFPAKVAGLQAAFRLSDPTWQAALRVERLPQAVQADVLHLFSIGEGIAYGSSVINYTVSGAPVSVFNVELSDEYYNVEFTGKDIRNWRKIAGGYQVQLHTPVSGPYTLLATYERPFRSQGETLTFTGARPADAQSEQGHTLIISAYQFQVKPVEVSAGLQPLETAEVPPEYRLFFDAPILAAYQYAARPFDLKLALTPLAQGDSLNQVVDRASLSTRISKEGQVLTTARYFVKNRGNPNFRLTLPPGTELWSVTINGSLVVPVKDGAANLIPLPSRADPNAPLDLQMTLASQSADAARVTVAAPILGAPVMLADWKVEPDAGQRLVYRSGSLAPVGGVPDISGFAGWARIFRGEEAGRAWTSLLAALALVGIALVAWRWAVRGGAQRYSARHLAGFAIGLAACALAVVEIGGLAGIARDQNATIPADVSFLVRVQQAESPLSVEVLNLASKASIGNLATALWPAALAVLVWLSGWRTENKTWKSIAPACGWTLVTWAALRSNNGAEIALWVFAAFLLVHLLLPALVRTWRVPHAPAVAPDSAAGASAAPAITLLIAALLLSNLAVVTTAHAGTPSPAIQAAQNSINGEPSSSERSTPSGTAESVVQNIRIEDQFALATAKIRWEAKRGDVLPLLQGDAVMTRLVYPTRNLKLVENPGGSQQGQQLLARDSGVFEIELGYQLRIQGGAVESSLVLPLRGGLINRLNFTVSGADVDVLSPVAVSVQRELTGSNTVAALVLSPGDATRIAWRPRSRDVKHEKPVYYADVSQLYVPLAGVIEGSHDVYIRPAQGEIGELVFDVPRGATIIDVLDWPGANTTAQNGRASIVSLWRFDPDARKLRITLNPPQSRPFSLTVRSQVATGPLPFAQSVGLLSVDGASGQIGLLGIATGNEVQIDNVDAAAFSPINLEDFPGNTVTPLAGQVAGLTVRRAFRYGDTTAAVAIKASAVEPDVRVETQDTLSLGEDRIVLASEVGVDITRAGIFRLSFVLPAGFDVETASGAALSHWTEAKNGDQRIITLHLTGKTDGHQKFSISLAGPGVKTAAEWNTPQIVFREAGKQRGTLVVAPEQGMRLQVAAREGITQLDPQRSGIEQKGVLAFRVLQAPSRLALDIEQVDPWIQVTSLEHATVTEAQIQVTGNLQYQIENTGLKSFHVYLPTNAESVHFHGDQVADYLAVAGAVTNGLQEWEIKLHRRVIGAYLLQAGFQIPLPNQPAQALLRGIEAADVNLQRGFVTVQSGARLQLSVDALPAALQPAEWQSIPRALQQDLAAVPANFSYRLVDPSFALPLKLARHEAAQLLAARINSVALDSVISDDGEMLTHARLEMQPGDTRLLNVALPKNARFWFAFVNRNGVWPWRGSDRILIPLEQPARGDKTISVELFYSASLGPAGSRSLDLELLAPNFDLPLENVSWRVALGDQWNVKHWSGSLQLAREELLPAAAAIDVENYLRDEATEQTAQTKAAQELLAQGNRALVEGDPQQARRSFQEAYGLSSSDAAFNEDARVQLHNIKLQQALVGLNVRQASAGGNVDALGANFHDLQNRKELNYSQQDAKDIMDRNSADENAAYMKLAERLVQQQDAAVGAVTALRANLPEQGRVLTFMRAVEVDPKADLGIRIEAAAARVAPGGLRAAAVVGTLVVLVGLFGIRRAALGADA